MRGKKRKLFASAIEIILVVIAVIAGFGWKEHKLEDIVAQLSRQKSKIFIMN